jgi:hypothetical protein
MPTIFSLYSEPRQLHCAGRRLEAFSNLTDVIMSSSLPKSLNNVLFIAVDIMMSQYLDRDGYTGMLHGYGFVTG